jgi:hypothetical protein
VQSLIDHSSNKQPSNPNTSTHIYELKKNTFFFIYNCRKVKSYVLINSLFFPFSWIMHCDINTICNPRNPILFTYPNYSNICLFIILRWCWCVFNFWPHVVHALPSDSHDNVEERYMYYWSSIKPDVDTSFFFFFCHKHETCTLFFFFFQVLSLSLSPPF